MNRFLLSILLITVSLGLHAQSSVNSEQKKVQQCVTNFFDGLSALDAKMMSENITRDFLLLESGEKWTIDTLISKIEPLRSLSFKRINHLDFIRTEIKGNTAWVAYDNIAEMTVNSQSMNRHWMESAILIKDGEKWKIQLLHSTTVNNKEN
jgi:hypothetical protein